MCRQFRSGGKGGLVIFFFGGGRGPAAVHFEHENKNGGIQEPRKETNR